MAKSKTIDQPFLAILIKIQLKYEKKINLHCINDERDHKVYEKNMFRMNSVWICSFERG